MLLCIQIKLNRSKETIRIAQVFAFLLVIKNKHLLHRECKLMIIFIHHHMINCCYFFCNKTSNRRRVTNHMCIEAACIFLLYFVEHSLSLSAPEFCNGVP